MQLQISGTSVVSVEIEVARFSLQDQEVRQCSA